MFYAHQGDSSDNGFITYNGHPVRSFKAFNTKKERQQYQDMVWEESGGSKNVIFCKRKDVTEFFPKFYVNGNDVYPTFEDFCISQELSRN